MSESNCNKLGRRIAPGFWIDADGNPHISIKELLKVAELEETPENRELVADMVRKIISRENPRTQFVERETPADTQFRCRRCGQAVDLVAMRCGCEQGPSPWERINS